MNEILSIQNTGGIIVTTKYAQFIKEYNEMVYATRMFVRKELEKVTLASSDEEKLLAAIEFRSKVYPPETYLTKTLSEIQGFILKNMAFDTNKELSLRDVFYLVELLKLNGRVADDKLPIDIINYMFAHKDFEVSETKVTFKKMTPDIPESLNEYEFIFNKFKEIVENVRTNSEIEDAVVKGLTMLSIIKLIVAEDTKVETKEEK